MDNSSENNHNPAWSIDETHPFLRPEIEEYLSSVSDPELGFSILELGLVRDIRIVDSKAHMIMILTSPFCPYGPRMLEDAREQLEKAISMPVTIELGSQMWDPTLMEKGLMNTDWGLYS
ncbi:MAG: iron-sulfur cluster assembly protein [Anaerolineaceae bacterium]|jgi:metal-sulfur cluster biosynthetic enzyme